MAACDNLVPTEHIAALIATQREKATNAVLSLLEIDIAQSARTGIIEWQDGWIKRIVEKPQPEDVPSNISSLLLYVFSPKLLDYLSQVQPSARCEYELQDAIQLLINDTGGVTGVLTPKRWQLTDVADLLALNRYFLAINRKHTHIPASVMGNNVVVHSPVLIDEGCTIGDDCIIGPNVYLEVDCQVAAGCQVCNAILLRGATVDVGSEIVDTVMMGSNTLGNNA